MTITVQVKLLPDLDQAGILLKTMEECNKACNWLSPKAFEAKIFRQYDLHKAFYYQVREQFPLLAAQSVVRIQAKVADAYKLQCKAAPKFREHGAITYDYQQLSWKFKEINQVSIWTVKGRQKISFVTGAKQIELLKTCNRGEADLIFREGAFYIHISVSIPEVEPTPYSDALGIDLGIVNIAFDSDGVKYSGTAVNKVRHRCFSLRKKLQKKQTRSANRLLKKRKHKEQRFVTNVNHVISKQIVVKAECTGRAIALESLEGIRNRVKACSRASRRTLHSWSFNQLRSFIEYKARMRGVAVVHVNPAFTSQKCSSCGYTHKTNRKNRDLFVCKQCNFTSNADFNGARNIRKDGLGSAFVNKPDERDQGKRACSSCTLECSD